MSFEILVALKGRRTIVRFVLVVALVMPLALSSCSKDPEQLQEEGMKAFAAKEYAKAQDYFAEGIKKDGNENLYAGFVAANLITGKYPEINSAYNTLCEGIHDFLASRYGEGIFFTAGITTKLVPYKVDGGNDIPSDYIQTILLQINVDFSGYIALKDRINGVLKK